MSHSISEIKGMLRKLTQEIEDRVSEAYDLGFNEGLGVVLPTQEEFDKYHATPQGYGDESEWVCVSANTHNEEAALRKIRRYLKKEWGWTGEELPTEVRMFNIGYKRHDGTELGYWLNEGGGFWQAWGVETQ